MTTHEDTLSMETTSAEARAFLERSRETLQQLAVLIRNSYLHDLTNQVFEEPLAKLVQSITQLVLTEGSFRLEGFGEEFFANGNRIRMEFRSLNAYKYVLNELGKRGVGGIYFESRPTVASVSAFLEVFSRARDDGGEERLLDRLNDELVEREVKGIKLLPVRSELTAPSSELGTDRRERALNAYQQALDFIRESMMTVDSPAQVNVRKAKRTVQKLVDLSYEEGNGFSLAGMASIKAHDDYTFNHMVNVCVLAIAFGQRLGLKRHSLAQLGLSALYHDMGKLHIPLDVLNKNDGFTEEQWAVMGNHTVYAARTLFPLIVVDRTTVNRILTSLQHHLRYDGTVIHGSGSAGSRASTRRITAIVDTFDAMTTKRIYQRQYLPDEAIAVMHQGAGSQLQSAAGQGLHQLHGHLPRRLRGRPSIGRARGGGGIQSRLQSSPSTPDPHGGRFAASSIFPSRARSPGQSSTASIRRSTESRARTMPSRKERDTKKKRPEGQSRPILWVGGSGLPGGAVGKKLVDLGYPLHWEPASPKAARSVAALAPALVVIDQEKLDRSLKNLLGALSELKPTVDLVVFQLRSREARAVPERLDGVLVRGPALDTADSSGAERHRRRPLLQGGRARAR